MRQSEIGGDRSMELIKIDIGARRIDAVAASHLLKQLVEFVLFMHHQVPDTIEHLQHTWENLDVDSKNDQPSNQRQKRARVRKAIRETKKLRKLTESIQNLISAAREAIQGLPGISSLLLLLGSSPSRPQMAYEVQFVISTSGLKTDESCKETCINVENLSRKMIRALISQDAGSLSLGPTKLFLMVKAPARSSVPHNFLPKQNYALMNKKVNLIGIQLLHTIDHDNKGETHTTLPSNVTWFIHHDDIDPMIWFQCKHVVKGLYSEPV